MPAGLPLLLPGQNDRGDADEDDRHDDRDGEEHAVVARRYGKELCDRIRGHGGVVEDLVPLREAQGPKDDEADERPAVRTAGDEPAAREDLRIQRRRRSVDGACRHPREAANPGPVPAELDVGAAERARGGYVARPVVNGLVPPGGLVPRASRLVPVADKAVVEPVRSRGRDQVADDRRELEEESPRPRGLEVPARDVLVPLQGVPRDGPAPRDVPKGLGAEEGRGEGRRGG